MLHFTEMSDETIQKELGSRLRRTRLTQNRTQQELAESAGVAQRTIANVEGGNGCSLTSLIAILRGLGKLNQLDQFLPAPSLSPIQLSDMAGKRRQRATGSRGSTHLKGEPAKAWRWGDEVDQIFSE